MSALGKEIAEAVIEAWFGQRLKASADEIAAADAAIAPIVESLDCLLQIVDMHVDREHYPDPDCPIERARAILARTGEA